MGMAVTVSVIRSYYCYGNGCYCLSNKELLLLWQWLHMQCKHGGVYINDYWKGGVHINDYWKGGVHISHRSIGGSAY